MKNTLHLSIVIPTYNESSRIINTLDVLANYFVDKNSDCEIIVSDDGSTDNTRDQVSMWIKQSNRSNNVDVSLISSAHKGKGAAVKRGMLKATGHYRIMFDADLAMLPSYIDEFIDNMEKGYDVVIASREILGARRFDEPYMRHLMGRIFNYYVRIFFVNSYQDTQCGYKCFTADSAEKLFSKQIINGWGFDVEILFLANKYSLSVLELPINWYHKDQSKIKPLKASFEMLKDTFLVKIRYIFRCYSID